MKLKNKNNEINFGNYKKRQRVPKGGPAPKQQLNRQQKLRIFMVVMINNKISQKDKMIIMMSLNLPKIVVAANVDEMTTLELCDAANAVKFTGDADCTAPPRTDVLLKGDATALFNLHSSREIAKDKSITQTEKEMVAKLKRWYAKCARYVQEVANDVAIAHGDIAAGHAVVFRTGFKLKSIAVMPPRQFEVIDSGPGWVKLRCKSIAKKAGYIWRYGVAPQRNVRPEEFSKDKTTLECIVTISNLKSGRIYGFAVAGVLPEKDPTVSDGEEPNNFCDFIYFQVQ